MFVLLSLLSYCFTFFSFFFFYPTFPVTNLGCRIHIYRFFCISSQDCCAGRSLHLLGFERRNGRVRCMWESLCRAFPSQDLQHHRELPKNYESLPPRIHNSAHNSASLEGLPTPLTLAIRRLSKYRSWHTRSVRFMETSKGSETEINHTGGDLRAHWEARGILKAGRKPAKDRASFSWDLCLAGRAGVYGGR